MVPLVVSGGIACILAYGQTSTGKTYTMSALELAIARDIFAGLEDKGQKLLQSSTQRAFDAYFWLSDDLPFVVNRPGTEAFEITVTFLEVVGKAVYDLSVPNPGIESERKVVDVSENKVGFFLFPHSLYLY